MQKIIKENLSFNDLLFLLDIVQTNQDELKNKTGEGL